jgi:hypothetical protein
METVEAPGWLKLLLSLCGGAFAWGLVVILFKAWVETNIIEAIAELRRGQVKTEQNFIAFTDRVNSLILEMMKDSKSSVANHSKILNQMSDEIRQAIHDSGAAIEKVYAVQVTADKLVKIATGVHEKNKHIESEVKRLSSEMIMVRSKK